MEIIGGWVKIYDQKGSHLMTYLYPVALFNVQNQQLEITDISANSCSDRLYCLFGKARRDFVNAAYGYTTGQFEAEWDTRVKGKNLPSVEDLRVVTKGLCPMLDSLRSLTTKINENTPSYEIEWNQGLFPLMASMVALGSFAPWR